MPAQIFSGILGFCFGLVIAAGVVGLMIGLAIVPRYAGITKTADCILLYEDMTFYGITLGNLCSVFGFSIPGGALLLILYGFFSGVFLGGWILALAEIADVFPVLFRRLKIREGFAAVVISAALGKTAATLLFFFLGWQ